MNNVFISIKNEIKGYYILVIVYQHILFNLPVIKWRSSALIEYCRPVAVFDGVITAKT